MAEMLRQQLLDTSRGRMTLLRTGTLTADDIATKLKLTQSAVRVQLSAMERDGVALVVGKRPGNTRPSHIYELTPELEQLLSKAYIPLLTHLVEIFAEALPAQQVDTLLRRTGKGPATKGSRAGSSSLSKKARGGVPSANRIRDADGDGVAETRSVLLAGLNSPFEMALVGNERFVANADALVRFPYLEGQMQITASATCSTEYGNASPPCA